MKKLIVLFFTAMTLQVLSSCGTLASVYSDAYRQAKIQQTGSANPDAQQ